jgi:hypothetical protein
VNPRAKTLLTLAALLVVTSGGSAWWAARQQAELGQQVAALARPGDIRMLSSQTCAICMAAHAWFVAHRIPFSECKIETDAACLREYEAVGSPGTPVMVVRGQAEAGFSPTRLKDRLKALS